MTWQLKLSALTPALTRSLCNSEKSKVYRWNKLDYSNIVCAVARYCQARVTSLGVGWKYPRRDNDRFHLSSIWTGTGFSVFAARKMEREPKNERYGEGMEGNLFPSFLPHPLPGLLFARSSFFARKPHVNSCYAGCMWGKRTTIFQGNKMLTLRS